MKKLARFLIWSVVVAAPLRAQDDPQARLKLVNEKVAAFEKQYAHVLIEGSIIGKGYDKHGQSILLVSGQATDCTAGNRGCGLQGRIVVGPMRGTNSKVGDTISMRAWYRENKQFGDEGAPLPTFGLEPYTVRTNDAGQRIYNNGMLDVYYEQGTLQKEIDNAKPPEQRAREAADAMEALRAKLRGVRSKIAAFEKEHPKKIVSGTISDMMKIEDGTLAYLVCDVDCSIFSHWFIVAHPVRSMIHTEAGSVAGTINGTYVGEAFFVKMIPDAAFINGRTFPAAFCETNPPPETFPLYSERDRVLQALVERQALAGKVIATTADRATGGKTEAEGEKAVHADFEAANKVTVEGRFEDSDERPNGDLTLVIVGSRRNLIALRQEDVGRFPNVRDLMGKKVKISAFSCDRSYPCLYRIEPVE